MAQLRQEHVGASAYAFEAAFSILGQSPSRSLPTALSV